MGTQVKRIRYAVVGAGHIAQEAILPAFQHATENSELVALISGDPDKRGVLCRRHGIEFEGGYEELEATLRRARADAVFIATPNALHKEHVIRAAEAGVHVLCEKPLATSVIDCELMSEACERNQVKLMVAYRLHFEEATLRAIDLVKRGGIGEPRVFDSVFTHVVRPGDIRTREELGGGAAYDLGVYCINAARSLFQAEPTSVFATTIKKNGVDDTTTAMLRFGGDRVATFTISNSVASVSSYRIAGTEGDLRVEPAYEYASGLKHHLTIDEKTSSDAFGKRDQFAPELIYFSRCILENQEPEPSGEEGLLDIRVVEAILQSAETGVVVELEPRDRERRPGLEQEIYRKPISNPKIVDAPSPSLR